MAHHAKVSAGAGAAAANLLAHDKRENRKERGNKRIDPALAARNADLSARPMGAAEAWAYAVRVAQEHSARKLRDNNVVLSCEVIHLPANWEEVSGGQDSLAFFEKVALPFYRQRYGRGEDLYNEVSAVVHRDEKRGDPPGRDHMHYKYVPIARDGRLSHKQVNGRTDLASLHRDLQRFADQVEGGRYAGLRLHDPEARAESAAALSMPEYQAAKDAERQALAARDAAEAERERAERSRDAARDEEFTATHAAREARREASQEAARAAESREDARKAQEAADAARTAQAASESARDAAEAQAHEVGERLERLRRGEEKIVPEVSRAQRDQRAASERESAARAARDAAAGRVEDLERQVEAARRGVAAARQDRDAAAARVEAARQDRDAATGRVGALRARLDRVTESIAEKCVTIWRTMGQIWGVSAEAADVAQRVADEAGVGYARWAVMSGPKPRDTGRGWPAPSLGRER